MASSPLKKESSSGKSELKEIWRRIRKRDFSGNTGQVVRNSFYQFLTQVTQRTGSLILTIILARVLMPELFGLYNLALSTILIFVTLSNLGVGATLVTFVSKSLGNNNKKLAKAYLYHAGKIKVILTIISITILLISARFIANNYYQKPIFLALIAGLLYISFSGLVSFFQSSLQSFNYFKGIFHNELVFEISRVILIPLAAIVTLKYSLSNENILFYIFIAFGISYIISAFFIRFFPYQKHRMSESNISTLEISQRKEIRTFFFGASAFTLSGIFFGYIDKVMLGHFVAAQYIGYYSAAFSLIGSLASVIGFGTVLLPTFSRLGKRELERGMKKSTRAILLISGFALLVTLALAYFVIWIIYGSSYSPSVDLLRAMTPLLMIIPLIGIYSAYFLSREKPQVLTTLLAISAALNIILNYILITSFLKFSELAAVYGAVIATIISNAVYLFGMIVWKKRRLSP